MKKRDKTNSQPEKNNLDSMKVRPPSEKTGILPRSIGRTINRILTDFSPRAEEQFRKNFRISQKRTRIAVRFLLLLIIIPLLTHQLSKQILIIPIVENVRNVTKSNIFINSEMEEAALQQLKFFEEKLKFESLIHPEQALSSDDREEKLKQKAREIAKEFWTKSNLAISNVFADMFSLIALALVVVTNKKAMEIVKSFLDEIVYGLSDSAKAFLIILFTDMFVGFHSPHGWEVILEGLAEHLGLPANREAIFLFIATFPVILDTIFKYWIFRYLSRLSPSALATLKEMNE